MSDSTVDLYTQDQRDYVDSVADTDLRAALLHQIRLRDLLKYDRDSYESRCVVLTDQVIELRKLLKQQEK